MKTQLLCTVLCDLCIEYWGVILILMYKKASLSDVQWQPACNCVWHLLRVEHCNHILLPYSYSLYEPKSHALMEYNGGLEKAILRDSELLSEVNDAFCKSHPLLAQKVVTRSARAAISKIGEDALVGGRSTSSNSTSLYAATAPATAARYIAAPLPSAASSSCSTAPAEQSCPHRHQQQLQQQSCSPPPAAEAGAPQLPAPAPPPAPVLAPVPPPPLRLLPPWPLPPPPAWLPWPEPGRCGHRRGWGRQRGQGGTYRTLRTHIHIISIIKFLPPPSLRKLKLICDPPEEKTYETSK